jgi:hypothetical protein
VVDKTTTPSRRAPGGTNFDTYPARVPIVMDDPLLRPPVLLALFGEVVRHKGGREEGMLLCYTWPCAHGQLMPTRQ